MKKFAAQLLSVSLLSGIAATAGAEECQFSSDRAANFNGPVKKVVVSAGAGYLKIRGEATGGVKATGRACASSESLLGKIALESRRENDTVYLTVVMAEGMGDMFSFGRYTSLDLDLTVPRDAELDVTDSSGDLELSDVGASKVDDSSGDQLLKNINGNLIINDSSGEIRVVSVVGNVEVEDSSGNIDIEDVRGDVKIKTDSSGDIAIAKVTGNAEIVEDSSGDITIRDVKKNATIDRDSSGSVNVSDIGGNFSVRAKTSGNILHERVGGSVRIPAKT
ncbi:DUF4097 family beta strand repeat-containing protein [Steroidobacter flavus]|uniref:DUF4097 family beta strand repeat-containing protein n=1 Tax=Steroidobacter flavus TaxID=1842136 RepID=A0ABV8SVG9_9GAMM